MKLYFFIILLLLTQQAAGQTVAEIKKHKIYRVDRQITVNNKPVLFSIYYDTLGRVIKQIDRTPFDKIEVVTSTKYLRDTLISQEKVDTYEGKVLLETTTTSYEYLFDGNERVISQQSKSSDGSLTRQVYSYDMRNRPDTVFLFNNDTTIWTNQPFTGKRELASSLVLKRVRIYCYHGDTVLLKDCEYPFESYDKTGCRTYVNIANDTSDISIEAFWGLHGCIADSVETVWTRKTLRDKNGEYYAENVWGEKEFYTNFRNSKGLLEKRAIKRIDAEGKVSEKSVRWIYYYRQ